MSDSDFAWITLLLLVIVLLACGFSKTPANYDHLGKDN